MSEIDMIEKNDRLSAATLGAVSGVIVGGVLANNTMDKPSEDDMFRELGIVMETAGGALLVGAIGALGVFIIDNKTIYRFAPADTISTQPEV